MLTAERLGEARLSAPVSPRWWLGGTLILDQLSAAIGIAGLVCKQDGAWTKVAQQSVRLPGCKAEANREALRIDDDVDLGRHPRGGTPCDLLAKSGSITRHLKSVRSYRLMASPNPSRP